MKRDFFKRSVVFIFLILWIIPLAIFMKDFFNIESLSILLKMRTYYILKNTMIQAGLSTIFSFIIALIPAYYISRKNNIFSKILENTVFIPFFFPAISAILSFSIIFLYIKSRFGIQISYSLLAILIGHCFYNSPIFVKQIGDGLKRIDESYIEEAKIAGANDIYIFFHIELPMIIHSIFKGFLLVFIYSFTSFAVVLSLGNLKYTSFELAIAQTLMNELDFSKAMAYSMIQLVILIGLNFILYRENVYSVGDEKREAKKLGIVFFFLSAIYIVFEYGVVLVGMVGGFFNFQTYKFDFSVIIKIFSSDFNREFPIIESMRNSFLLAFLAGLIIIMITYIILKIGKKYTEIFVMSSLGVSSVFIAMCLYYMNILYGISLEILLLLGFLQVSLAMAYSFLYKAVKGFDQSLIEAAKLDRAGFWEIFFHIEFPILKPVFVTVFLQIFAILYGEFTIVYTMQIAKNFPLVSVLNYSMLSKKMLMESAVFSSVNVAIVYILYILSKFFSEKKY